VLPTPAPEEEEVIEYATVAGEGTLYRVYPRADGITLVPVHGTTHDGKETWSTVVVPLLEAKPPRATITPLTRSQKDQAAVLA
jgi:hypothetical protein